MSSLKVAVRVRPFNGREMDMDAQLIVEMEGKKTRLFKPKLQTIREAGRDNHHDFTFDFSYWSFDEQDKHFATQEQVYNDLGTDVIDCAFQGYNACVFAYGQTGSGKTFTMMGTHANPGLIPRICQELFARMRVGQESGTGFKTHASYLEIYNERVKDLLGPQTNGHGLRVREHSSLGPYVENLSQHVVSDFEEIQECISRGNMQRTTASTNMNDTSSRSHAIFTITFVQAVFMNDMPSETVSKIHLVDLAGSERANATGATGQRLKEGAHINKSLVTLGSVISALAEQTKTVTPSNGATSKRVLYIPYRDSILTWLLKDSLGGNSKTIMIAALSPADCNYSETLSTLRYANRAKNIINKPTINEDANVKLIRELREEINKLKSMLTGEIHSLQPSAKVLEDLHKKEAQEKVLTEEWTEKWREAQLILQEQKSLGLRKSGVGVVLDSEMPHLIGIHNDITTGVTLYSLKEGETLIGTADADTPPDIELTGDGIEPQHCSIVHKDGVVTLHPHIGAQCWINAHLIAEPKLISQGDIILLGRTNIFRFNNPAEAAKLQKDLNRSQLDMTRLSLIASSRENLLSSSFYSEDDVMSTSVSSSPYKRVDRQYYPTNPITREDPEMQDENRKILETIENALKQLNLERVQMHNQHKSKVRKLTEELRRLEIEQPDSIEVLKYRENELLARIDMLTWEKNNEKVQIDIMYRQISAIQMQLDSKKRDFSEYVAKELQELQDCGKLDEIGIKIDVGTPLNDNLLLKVAESLDLFSSQFIKDTVKRSNEEICKLDDQICEKESMLNESTLKIAKLDENLLKIANQLEGLQRDREKCEFETLKLRNNERLKLDKSETAIGTEKCEDIPKPNNKNKVPPIDTGLLPVSLLRNIPIEEKECMSLSNSSSDEGESYDYETTKQIESTASSTSHSCKGESNQCKEECSSNTDKTKITPVQIGIMSDSGVCLESVKQINGNTYLSNSSASHETKRNGLRSSDDEISCSSFENARFNDVAYPFCPMHALRRKIASQKALIMKNLELEHVNKEELDAQITNLQELQKRYIKMEKQFLKTDLGADTHAQCCSDEANSNYDYKSADNNDIMPGSSSITLGPNLADERTYLASMTRSCPSMRDFYDNTDHIVSIPNFLVRGAGKKTHYEYEIKIILPDGNLNILRRYSRFRDLHMNMKHLYGVKISSLPFPKREIFSSNTDAVAKHRRRLLELYLRGLFELCSKIAQCPIFIGSGGPGITRSSLAQLSPFFKKGLFENGKHGTG